MLRNKANYLGHELDLFEDAYLKIHHWSKTYNFCWMLSAVVVNLFIETILCTRFGWYSWGITDTSHQTLQILSTSNFRWLMIWYLSFKMRITYKHCCHVSVVPWLHIYYFRQYSADSFVIRFQGYYYDLFKRLYTDSIPDLFYWFEVRNDNKLYICRICRSFYYFCAIYLALFCEFINLIILITRWLS